MMDHWLIGADVSTLLEVEQCGGKFYDNGQQGDALEILRGYGINMVRLRLWNHPYSPDGVPYGAGTCDLPQVMALARRVKALGLDWMLDFHYSDFWADPGKQIPPKAWADLDAEELESAIYEYTADTLAMLRDAEISPSIVSVGNEITAGLLWPLGKYPNFDNITRFLNAAIRAVRETAPKVSIMIHLDNGGRNDLYRDWFDRYFAAGGRDFEYIGLSFYTFWHGGMEDLRQNMNDIAMRYHKDLIVAETSTGFTLEDYRKWERLPAKKRKGMAATPALAAKIAYPMTPKVSVNTFAIWRL